MPSLIHLATSALATLQAVTALSNTLAGSGSGGQRQTIRDLEREIQARQHARRVVRRDTDPSLLYPEHNFSTPIDHFHNESRYAPHSNGTFDLRYWFDASHYAPGGPVIILQSGETDAEARLPYLQKGILAQLAQATHGIGVVLEHRYYGTSFPTPDLSTENLRFLTTQQALADEAYFAQNIQFPGLEKYGDLSSNTTAYLSYGGSYAGAFSAFLRVQYPDIFWGSISSSGVTKAIYDYWEYYEPIAQYGPPACIAAQKTLTHIVDNILIGKNDTHLTAQLKEAFGMPNVTYDDDFANQLAQGISYWQSLNWDPTVSVPEVYHYCANISDTEVLYPATESLRDSVMDLIKEAGYAANGSIVNQMLNYVGYVGLMQVESCAAAGETQDQCFGNHNATYYQQDSLSQYGVRSWSYQYCTEWGFLQTGSGVPPDQEPLISRTLDLPYEMIICNDAFNISSPPDTEAVNKYGGYEISYPRLAIVDGEWDPWRPATPHAFGKMDFTTAAGSGVKRRRQMQEVLGYGAQNRISTASQPFVLISEAVHHYDENGRFPNQTTAVLPPAPVANTQELEVMFVREWMQEWELKCLVQGGGCS